MVIRCSWHLLRIEDENAGGVTTLVLSWDFTNTINKKMQIPQPLTLDEIPEDEQEALLTKVATEIVRRRLTVPAILFLETCKPINFIGSQMLIALNPFVTSIFNTAEYQKFALIIEKDANVELLTQLIEKLDGEEKK